MSTGEMMKIKVLTAALPLLLILMCETSYASPKVGIHYITWFDNEGPSLGCAGGGWSTATTGPFGFPNGSVVPLTTGHCYSSNDPYAAGLHASFLHGLGVDFVILDETNLSKALDPAQNRLFQSSKKVIYGLKAYTEKKVQVTFQISLTCWASACHGGTKNVEVFTYNDHVKKHIEEIAQLHEANPGRFVIYKEKPLLLVYLNGGSNVYASENDTSPYFDGPGALIPTADQWNPLIEVNGGRVRVRDYFTVRFTLAAFNQFDYRPFSNEIWPFSCEYGCETSEAGVTSLYSPAWGRRDMGHFSRQVDAASDRDFLLIRSWNEFSTTDEYMGRAVTIEPNTKLHTVDSTPGNQDGWYFFNAIKVKLNAGKQFRIRSKNSNKCIGTSDGSISNGATLVQKDCANSPDQRWVLNFHGAGEDRYLSIAGSSQCMDIKEASSANGADAQIYACLGSSATNQTWQVVSVGAEEYKIVAKHSDKCLDVRGGLAAMSSHVPLQQWDCLGNANQVWILDRL